MHTTVTPPEDWDPLRVALRAFVRRRVRHDADVDDIVQHCFVKLQQHRDHLRDADRLHAWMYRTARNAVIDHYRTHARHVMVPIDTVVEPPAPAAESAEAQPPSHALARCMPRLIDTLTPADQQALRLVDLEGRRQTDTASALGVSVSGVKSRVQRARKRLKATVEACCEVHLDTRGGVMSYERRSSPCPCATPCGVVDA